jgi:hypothetical protein
MDDTGKPNPDPFLAELAALEAIAMKLDESSRLFQHLVSALDPRSACSVGRPSQ